MTPALNRRRALHHLAGLGAALAMPAFGQADRPIVLGQSAAVSGPAAQLGLQMHAGAKLHFDAVNAQGGVGGRPIELRLLDDGYEPDRCKANTEQFIAQNMFALFGYVGTPTSLAALPLVNQSRLPFFGPFSGAMALRDPFSHSVFHVRASYHDETALIVRQLTELGRKKIAVFRQDDSYGQAGLDGVQHALAAQGMEPAAIGLVKRNTVDVAAAVAGIVAARPDAVVQIGAYKSCAAFIRGARKAGYGGSFYNVSFVGTQALADELGKDAHGVMVTQVMPYPFSPALGISRDYLQALQQAGGTAKPDYTSMEGYVAARVFVEALRRAGKNPDREALIKALESLQRFDLGGFQVNFGPRSHVASQFVELTMLAADGRVRR